MDGKTLRRVLDEASKRWVYRPVDAASGETISKEDFEARRREEEAARRASDPRHRAAEEKRWLEQQRGDIREKRAEASRAMRREEHHAALRDGRVERRRPRRKGALVEVPVPDALAELREEMRLATLRETRKKNPGRFAFIETALAVEERKHETALDAARRRACAAERRRKGVRGGGESGSDSESDDASDDAPPFALRGSAADLDDPDYRRGPPAATNSGTMQNGVPGDVPGGSSGRGSRGGMMARGTRGGPGASRDDEGNDEGNEPPSAFRSSSSRGGRGGRGSRRVPPRRRAEVAAPAVRVPVRVPVRLPGAGKRRERRFRRARRRERRRFPSSRRRETEREPKTGRGPAVSRGRPGGRRPGTGTRRPGTRTRKRAGERRR